MYCLVPSAAELGRSFLGFVSLIWAASVLFFSFEAHGIGSPQEVLRLADLQAAKAMALEGSGNWSEAIPIRREMYESVGRAFGEGHPRTDDARQALSFCLSAVGEYAEARPLLELSESVCREALGRSNPRTIRCAIMVGETHRREGDDARASECYARAESSMDGVDLHDTLWMTLWNAKANIAASGGDKILARKLWRKALENSGDIGTNRNVGIAVVLASKAANDVSLGMLSEAERDARLACEMFGSSETVQRHQAFAILGTVLVRMGRLQEGVTLLRSSATNSVRLLTTPTLESISIVIELSKALRDAGETAEALRLLESCQEKLLHLKTGGMPLLATLLVIEGDCLVSLGDWDQAKERYARVAGVVGETNSVAIAARERLGDCHLAQGRVAEAMKHWESVSRVRRRASTESPRAFNDWLTFELGWVRKERSLGRLDLARSRLKRIAEAATQGTVTDPYSRIQIINEQGMLAMASGRQVEAEQLFRRAVGASAEVGENGEILTCRLNLSVALTHQNRLSEALVEIERAVKEVAEKRGPRTPMSVVAALNRGWILRRQGRLIEAVEHFDQIPSDALNENLDALRDIPALQWELGRRSEAVRTVRRYLGEHSKRWQEVVRIGSVQDRLAWLYDHAPFSTAACVAEEDPRIIANTVTENKALVLDSIIEDGLIAGRLLDGDREVARLAETRRLRSRLENMHRSNPERVAARLTLARKDTDFLERQLAKKYDGIARRPVRLASNIADRLEMDEALVEFVEYERVMAGGKRQLRLGAVVLRRSTEPKWVDLGESSGVSGIGGCTRRWQAGLRGTGLTNVLTDSRAQALLSELHDRVWKPVAAVIPTNATRIIISPDAEVNFVPFAALWADGGFLGERIDFRYVSTGRDLLEPDYTMSPVRKVCALGDPKFTRSGLGGLERKLGSKVLESPFLQYFTGVDEGDRSRVSETPYSPLPNTEAEVEFFVTTAKRNDLTVDRVLIGAEATERGLRQCVSPFILHVATHGTFTRPSERPGSADLGVVGDRRAWVSNPMQCNWLALSGANDTFEAWKAGQVPDPENDGVLTAEEAASLQLHGTWLVALSACDAGLGMERSGEGVFGLRRAFALAGARHLLVTLWPVGDAETRDLMGAFYKDALSTLDAPGALSRTQRNYLLHWKKTRGIAQAARYAGPFAMISRGR